MGHFCDDGCGLSVGVAERSRSGRGERVRRLSRITWWGVDQVGQREVARGEDPLEKGGWAVLRLDVGVGLWSDSQLPALQHQVHREGWRGQGER